MLDVFVSEEDSGIEVLSITAVEATLTAFDSRRVDGETSSVPAAGDNTNDDDLLVTTCFNFDVEFPSFAIFILFVAETLPALVEINSADFAGFFPEGGVLTPVVGFFDDDDRLEAAFFTFGAGGAFFAVFDFFATGALRAVDDGDLAFLFGVSCGEGPVVEAAGLTPASFTADDFLVFATFFTDGEPFAVPILDAFDPGVSFSFFGLVATSVFFELEAGTAALPLANLESGTPKYAVKGRCCKDILYVPQTPN